MNYVINMSLVHSEFGNGVLKSFEGDKIAVKFSDGQIVKFYFPMVFECGKLKTTNEEDEKRIQELIARRRAMVKQIKVDTAQNVTESVVKNAEKSNAESGAKQRQKKTIKERANIKINFGKATFGVGLALAIISLCGIICVIVCGSLMGAVDAAKSNDLFIGFYIGWAVFGVVGFLAHCVFNFLAERGEGKAATTVFLVLTFIPYYLLVSFVMIIGYVIGMIIGLFMGHFGSGSSSKSAQKVWEVYDNGFKRTLIENDKVYVDGQWYRSFRDDIGQNWISKDGKHFQKRI